MEIFEIGKNPHFRGQRPGGCRVKRRPGRVHAAGFGPQWQGSGGPAAAHRMMAKGTLPVEAWGPWWRWSRVGHGFPGQPARVVTVTVNMGTPAVCGQWLPAAGAGAGACRDGLATPLSAACGYLSPRPPGSTWPRHPDPRPGVPCTAPAFLNFSTGPRSSGPEVLRRSSPGPGPCPRGPSGP